MRKIGLSVICGIAIGWLMGLTMTVVAQKPMFQEPAVEMAQMPGGVLPNGNVKFLKLDKDGYVMATCRNEAQRSGIVKP